MILVVNSLTNHIRLFICSCFVFIITGTVYNLSEIAVCFISCIYLVKVEGTLANFIAMDGVVSIEVELMFVKFHNFILGTIVSKEISNILYL